MWIFYILWYVGIDFDTSIFGFEEVFANDLPWREQTWETQSQLEQMQWLETLLRWLYLIMWPLLAIAWASLDNSLVYGEIFYLDRTLWRFWQIMRNIAMFSIWLIFIGSILAAFLYPNNEKLKLPKIVKNTFIAGILINMSRWVVAVLLDFSTVWVLTVWALPLNVIGQGADPNAPQQDEQIIHLSNVPFLKQHMSYNFDGSWDENQDKTEHAIIYSCAGSQSVDDTYGKYYIPCVIENDAFVGTQKWIEFVWQQIAVWQTIDPTISLTSINQDYCVLWISLIERPVGDWLSSVAVDASALKDLRESWRQHMLNEWQCNTLDKLISSAEGLTWPLYNLFAVIMHMGELSLGTNNMGIVETTLEFLVRLVIWLALVVPLFALAVVLVIRAVILWLIIAFSPFLLMMYVYEFKLGETAEKAWVKNVLSLIFLPVVAVFAISMSLIFLSLISRFSMIKQVSECSQDAWTILWARVYCPDNNPLTKCYDFYGVTTICFDESDRKTWANIVNTFAWLVTNIFGIAMMWMIVFAALKTSKLTETVVSTIESRGKTIAGAVPIIPVGWWVSLSGLKQTADKVSRLPNRLAEDQYNNSAIADYLNQIDADMSWSANEGKEKLTKALTWSQKDAENAWDSFNAAQWTNYKDYGSDLPQTLARAANAKNRKSITTMEEALKDDAVQNFLTKRWEYGTDKFIEKIINTNTEAKGTSWYKQKSNMLHILREWRGGLLHEENSADGKQKIQYFRPGGSGAAGVLRSVQDWSWNDQSMQTYDIGELRTKDQLNSFKKLITDGYWWDLAKVPDTILSSKAKDLKKEIRDTIYDATNALGIIKDDNGKKHLAWGREGAWDKATYTHKVFFTKDTKDGSTVINIWDIVAAPKDTPFTLKTS